MTSEKVPYKDIVKENITLHELEPIPLERDYWLRIRIKGFVLLDPSGNEYERGPCISIQLMHGRRFLQALSLPRDAERKVMAGLEEAIRYLDRLTIGVK